MVIYNIKIPNSIKLIMISSFSNIGNESFLICHLIQVLVNYRRSRGRRFYDYWAVYSFERRICPPPGSSGMSGKCHRRHPHRPNPLFLLLQFIIIVLTIQLASRLCPFIWLVYHSLCYAIIFHLRIHWMDARDYFSCAEVYSYYYYSNYPNSLILLILIFVELGISDPPWKPRHTFCY